MKQGSEITYIVAKMKE